jgi:hypothetical protein
MKLDGTSSFHRTAERLTDRPRAAARLASLTSFTDSVRIPCTAANRAYLRRLRALELAAWENARPINWPITGR